MSENNKLWTHLLPFDEADLIFYLSLALEELKWDPEGASKKLEVTEEEVAKITDNLYYYLFPNNTKGKNNDA